MAHRPGIHKTTFGSFPDLGHVITSEINYSDSRFETWGEVYGNDVELLDNFDRFDDDDTAAHHNAMCREVRDVILARIGKRDPMLALRLAADSASAFGKDVWA